MLSWQIIFNIILSSTIYLLLAYSYSLIYYPAKFFHLAHAAVITLGGYFVFLFAIKFALPFSLSVVLAYGLAIGTGLLCEILVYRKMRQRNVPILAYFIASIGLYVVLQNSISLYFGDETKIINTSSVTVGHQMLGAYLTTVQL